MQNLALAQPVQSGYALRARLEPTLWAHLTLRVTPWSAAGRPNIHTTLARAEQPAHHLS